MPPKSLILEQKTEPLGRHARGLPGIAIAKVMP
jgi:hypothetical protein